MTLRTPCRFGNIFKQAQPCDLILLEGKHVRQLILRELCRYNRELSPILFTEMRFFIRAMRLLYAALKGSLLGGSITGSIAWSMRFGR